MDIPTDPGLRPSQKRTNTDNQNTPPGKKVRSLALSEDEERKMQYHVGYFEARIDGLLSRDDVGFAIVVGMTAAGGAELDTTNMERAFSKHENGLGFAVLKEIDPSQAKLRALLKSAAKFPYKEKVPSLKVICFYFAGHGGGDSETNQPFIVTSDGITLHVQEMVKKFYPIHTPNMPADIQRLFFFDMCLGTNDDSGVTMRASGISTRNLPAIDAVPAQGNCLVAFATSFNYTSGGDKREGGFWTRFLHQNITRDQDIFEMLADTWEGTVGFTNKLAQDLGTPEIQGPSLTACMGHLNLSQLKDQTQFGKQEVQYLGPPQQVTRRIVVTDGDLRDTDPILKKEPKLNHLMNWLVTLEPNWHDFGLSLKVAQHKLKSFDRDRGDDIGRLSNTLDEWRRSLCSPYTFEQLISSLKERNYNDAIETVKRKLQDKEVRREYSL